VLFFSLFVFRCICFHPVCVFASAFLAGRLDGPFVLSLLLLSPCWDSCIIMVSKLVAFFLPFRSFASTFFQDNLRGLGCDGVCEFLLLKAVPGPPLELPLLLLTLLLSCFSLVLFAHFWCFTICFLWRFPPTWDWYAASSINSTLHMVQKRVAVPAVDIFPLSWLMRKRNERNY
jgi:hypothetical protein